MNFISITYRFIPAGLLRKHFHVFAKRRRRTRPPLSSISRGICRIWLLSSFYGILAGADHFTVQIKSKQAKVVTTTTRSTSEGLVNVQETVRKWFCGEMSFVCRYRVIAFEQRKTENRKGRTSVPTKGEQLKYQEPVADPGIDFGRGTRWLWVRQSERRAGRGHSSASHSGQPVKIRS